MEQKHFHLHALSALHVGSGQGVGVVDLPIARARATHLPLVPGSGIKGVLRDEFAGMARHSVLFGPESLVEGAAHAGALAVGDAHLLILPVRSFNGVVAFATCPFILARYQRDMGLTCGLPAPAENQAVALDETLLASAGQVLLEDLDLMLNTADANGAPFANAIADALYPDPADELWRQEFRKRFVVLPDSVFSFLADTATEVRARVRINDQTRTVKRGALWYEENLPAETVLWGLIGVSASRSRDDPASAADLAALLPTGAQNLQIGGKHTVGRGLCRFVLA